VRCAIILRLRVNGGASSLETEHDDHTGARGQEQDTTTDPVNHKRGEESPEQVPDLKDTVDEELDGGINDADGYEDLVEVVGDETVTRPLGEESKGDDDPHASPVSRGGEEGLPADGRCDLAIELDGGLDFLEFIPDKGIFPVTVGVVVRQDVQSLIVASLANQPTGGLGNEPDEADL